MSNMRCVTKKPPNIFTNEMSAALAANASIELVGTTWSPVTDKSRAFLLDKRNRTQETIQVKRQATNSISLPIKRMPPTAVMPEMAFVTLINGECNAGVTPQTV